MLKQREKIQDIRELEFKALSDDECLKINGGSAINSDVSIIIITLTANFEVTVPSID